MSDPYRPDPRSIPVDRAAGWSGRRTDGTAASSPRDDDRFVRPFVVTAGRTTPLLDGLRIETLVRAAPAALSASLRFEQSAVVRLCQQPHSIAEIGTALSVPIGVAKVVVSDLAADGYVTVRAADHLTTAAIERIRDLVRAL